MRVLAKHGYFLPLMGALIALAWLALFTWGQSPHARFHHHPGGPGGGGLMLVFIAGWTLMVVAMMLPTSLPLVTSFRTLTRRRVDRGQLITLLLAGYLGVWILFGVVIYAGGEVLRHAIEHSTWVQADAWALGAATVAFAGLYQFTPLKYHCLDKCRSPLSFIMEHWRGRHDRARAFWLGAHHGLYCLGCCWSLMLVMFAVGVGNVGWMLALAAVMATEKNMPWGRRLSAPLGVFLLGWGLALFTSAALWGAA